MTAVLSDSVLNGRFSVHEKPITAPGKCACCGSVNKPVVDFGFTVDYYGAVLMCGECIREALALLDTVFPVEGVQDQVVPLPAIDVEAINVYVRTASDAIDRLRSVLPDVVLPVEESEELPDDPDPDAGITNEADNAYDKSVSIEGPDDSTDVGNIFDIK